MGTTDARCGSQDVALEVEIAFVIPRTTVGVKVAICFAVRVLARECGGEGSLGVVARGDTFGVVEIDFAVLVIVDAVATGPDLGTAQDLSLSVGFTPRCRGRGGVGRVALGFTRTIVLRGRLVVLLGVVAVSPRGCLIALTGVVVVVSSGGGVVSCGVCSFVNAVGGRCRGIVGIFDTEGATALNCCF